MAFLALAAMLIIDGLHNGCMLIEGSAVLWDFPAGWV